MQSRPFEEARLKAIKEKRRKYEKRPFDATKGDMAYLLGLRHGDISVTKPWANAAEAIRVSTSTTHLAMAELFTNLFSPYGHVYMHPRYKKDTQSHGWNLNAILDGSFVFLNEGRETAWKWIVEDETNTLSYLAGVLDAEGSVVITAIEKRTVLMLCYYNTNLDLLRFLSKSLRRLGYNPIGPYLDKHKGSNSAKYGIPHSKDCWHIALSRFAECQALLRRLPIKHPEKVRKAQLAISLVDSGPGHQSAKKWKLSVIQFLQPVTNSSKPKPSTG